VAAAAGVEPRVFLQLLQLLGSHLVHGLLDGALVTLVGHGHCDWSTRRPMKQQGEGRRGGAGLIFVSNISNE